jgi:hypothetical protein
MTNSLRLLARLVGRAGTSLPLAEVLVDLARFAESIAPATRCSIVLVDPLSNALRLVAAPSLDRASLERCDHQSLDKGFGICAAAVSHRAMVVVDRNDPRSFASCRGTCSGDPLGWCSSAPFCDECGSVAGAVSMYARSAGPGRAHADELRLVAQLASLVVIRHREAERARGEAEALRRLSEHEDVGAPQQDCGLLARQIAAAATQLAGVTARLHPSDAGLAGVLRRIEARLATCVATLRNPDGGASSVAPGRIRVT